MSDTSEQHTAGIRARTASDYGYPVHRSRLACARDANVFVWWPSERVARVVACFNADVTPVTAKTLLRWIGVRRQSISPSQDDDDHNNEDEDNVSDNDDDEDDANDEDEYDTDDCEEAEVAEIKRVQLGHRGVFMYALKPLEGLKDSDLVVPGIYGCFIEGGPPRAPTGVRPIMPNIHAQPLAQLQMDQLGYLELNYGERETWPRIRENVIGWRSVPEDMRAEVTMPHDTCVFTGAKNDPDTSIVVKLHWIFPPAQCTENLNGTWKIPREVVLTEDIAFCALNVLPMRTDVHELWIANELSVDVDDDYRIYAFSEAAGRIEGLRRTLDAPKADWDPFLREHLLQTVLLRVNDGNIMEEYGVHDWMAKKEQLAEGNLQDEVWREPIGQDAFRLLYPDGLLLPTSRSSSSLGASGSDSEDAEDDDSEDSEDGDSEDTEDGDSEDD